MKVYCKECNSITKHRQKGLRPPVNVCNKCDTINTNIMLIREHDSLTKRGDTVKFVEWSTDELGSRGKELHDEPQVGFSCIVDPQYSYQYTWLTTPIIEIESDVEMGSFRCITFKTENSSYKLHIAKNE